MRITSVKVIFGRSWQECLAHALESRGNELHTSLFFSKGINENSRIKNLN